MKSKTTLVRQRKIDDLCEALNNLVYFISHYQKSNLHIIKHKERTTVLKITTSWKTELEAYQKIYKNSNTQPSDPDGTADTQEGIEK